MYAEGNDLIPSNPLPGKHALGQIVTEASLALALLDADRLEEIADWCMALDLSSLNAEESASLARQAQEAASSMSIFARVLDATRANLSVMQRLRELSQGGTGFTSRQSALPEAVHGHD